nr:hypothetical protein Iba_chr02cCG9530 [Ipomoea batatas]
MQVTAGHVRRRLPSFRHSRFGREGAEHYRFCSFHFSALAARRFPAPGGDRAKFFTLSRDEDESRRPESLGEHWTIWGVWPKQVKVGATPPTELEETRQRDKGPNLLDSTAESLSCIATKKDARFPDMTRAQQRNRQGLTVRLSRQGRTLAEDRSPLQVKSMFSMQALDVPKRGRGRTDPGSHKDGVRDGSAARGREAARPSIRENQQAKHAAEYAHAFGSMATARVRAFVESLHGDIALKNRENSNR